MLEPRLYRAPLLIGLAAAVVLMFSVVSRPEPVRTSTAPDAFDSSSAASSARELLRLAPSREPGSPGDMAAAEFVRERFEAIAGGQVTRQSFDGRFEGEDVSLANVTLVLPGLSSRRIVIAAPRDCAEGSCPVSSAASTGALLGLASSFDGARHRKTLVFVSLDGSAAGAAGAEELGRALDDEPADAVIVVTQPAAANREEPLVVPWSSGPQSTSVQLTESAEAAVEGELRTESGLRTPTFESLRRLAIPTGLTDQAPLIAEGADAIAITAGGERPLRGDEDTLANFSPSTLGSIGRAALSLALALDAQQPALEHGPEAYVPLAGKLIPGWALSLLALTLLIPIGIVSIDALARSKRHGEPIGPALAWISIRTVPFVIAMLLAYAMALVGLMPEPAFPFDPDRHRLDLAALLSLLALAVAFLGGLRLTGLVPLTDAADQALVPAIGLALFAAGLGVWLANPFLALLLVPTVHLWLGAALLRGRPGVVAAVAAAGLVVPCLALISLATQLDVGLSAPWELVLMFTGRHFGPLAVVPLCLLGGCLLALLSVAASRPGRPVVVRPGGRVRGPLSYAGPGSLGGTESALPRR